MGSAKEPAQKRNIFRLVVQGISVILLSVAIALPDWLHNPTGLLGYPAERRWGLFKVHGKTAESNKNVWEKACRITEIIRAKNEPSNPLLRFYSQKCEGYRLMYIASIVVTVLLFLAIVTLLVGPVLSIKNTKKSRKLSRVLALLAPCLCIVATIVFFYLYSEGFSMINSETYYPVPNPGVSIILLGVSIFLQVIAAFAFGTQLDSAKNPAKYEAMKANNSSDMYYEPASDYSKHRK